MIGPAKSRSGVLAGAVIVRGASLFALWLAMAGAKPADLSIGIVVSAGGLWASLILMPPGILSPGGRRIRLLPIIHLLGRTLWLSVVAGVDVARRALGPHLALDPGFVRYRPKIPAGPMRNAFTCLTSLVPGTVPAGSEPDGTIVVHCLDRTQPVAGSMARDEALLRRALGEGWNG